MTAGIPSSRAHWASATRVRCVCSGWWTLANRPSCWSASNSTTLCGRTVSCSFTALRLDLAQLGDRRGEHGEPFRLPGPGGDEHHVLDPERRGRPAAADELVAGLAGFQPGAQRLLDRLVRPAGVGAVTG